MNTDISELSKLSGFVGACLVDGSCGLTLVTEGGPGLDFDVVGAVSTDVLRSNHAALEMTGFETNVQDVQFTLGKQFQLILPLENNPEVFLHVTLDRANANLGMARVKARQVVADLKLN